MSCESYGQALCLYTSSAQINQWPRQLRYDDDGDDDCEDGDEYDEDGNDGDDPRHC